MNEKSLKLIGALALGIILTLTVFIGGSKTVLGDNQVNGDTITPIQTISGVWSGTLTATTDITITSGVVITVAPGTTIQVENSDSASAGLDPARIEFIVQSGGELRVMGPVTFTSKAATPLPADWYGIRFEPGSSGWIDDAIIEYGVHGVTLDTAYPVTVSNSVLRYNLHQPSSGAMAFGAGLYIPQGNHLISNTLIYLNAAIASGTGQARGGGVYIQGGSPHIFESGIYENVVSGDNLGAGGGIALASGGALIESSHILSNVITGGGNNQLKSGGGIGFAGHTTAVISASSISANRNDLTDGYAGGGGIAFADQSSAALIERNIIYANYIQGPDWCEGGGIDAWNTTNSAIIRNNLIISNTSGACLTGYGAYGGGMNMNGSATGLYVVNNTIVGNTAGRGGGLYLQNGSVTATNNIVVNNTAAITGYAGGIQRDAGLADYNDIFDNSTPQTGGAMGAGTIYVDPMFVSAGDLATFYHIQQGSPVIDAGTNAGAGLPNSDYDGQSRPLGATWDIGFDEVDPFTYTKSVDLDTARGNDTLVYTIVVTNPDPIATFVSGVITDALSPNVTYSTGPNCNSGTCNYNGSNAITWTGDISADDVLTLDYSVSVATGLADETEITNTAFITVGAVGGWTNIVTATVYNPVFTLTKATAGTIVGAPVTYTLTITNSSVKAEASGVVVSDTLPAGATYVPASGGALSGNDVTWNIASILTDSNVQVSFAVTTCQSSLTNDTYQVVGSDQGVSSEMGASLVTNLTNPTLNASFDYAPTGDIIMDQSVSFTDTSTSNGGSIVAWAWDFGDANTAGGAMTGHAYGAPGLYTVTLLITDTCGFTATAELGLGIFADLSVNIAGTGAVDVDPTPGPYSAGDVVTLTATANPGWTFDSWSGDAGGILTQTTITMDGNKVVTATFTQDEYALDVTVSPAGGGSVISSPAQSTYHYGDVVTLTVTANPGWEFTGWLDPLNGSGLIPILTNPMTITILGDRVITATFTQNEYTLDVTVSPAGGGSVAKDPNQTTYHYGDVVTLTSTANPGWAFDSWSGDAGGTSNPVTVTMTSDKAVTAAFAQDEYALDVTVVGNGSVEMSPGEPYHYGDVVTLTAAAAAGWSFDAWSGDASGVLTETTVTMTGNKAVTATFVTQPCAGATGVDLNLLTQGTLTPTTPVQFSADIAPDDAAKPYTYTLNFGSGAGSQLNSSDDPLLFSHIFGAVGTYTVEIAVWNCAMSSTSAITDAAQITISPAAESGHTIYLPLVMKQ